MTDQAWIQWCQKQLADLSLRLYQQGYQPSRIEHLLRTSPEFSEQFQAFMDQMNQVMNNMEENPDGYHHFEDFSQAKMALLKYTNLNREHFLDLHLAQTA